MKRNQPKRDWTAARLKCDSEGCRVCGLPAEAAHVIGRVHDKTPALYGSEPYEVVPTRIIPLCPGHHRAYDSHELDLSGYVRLPEALQAVADAGSIELARKRLIGGES